MGNPPPRKIWLFRALALVLGLASPVVLELALDLAAWPTLPTPTLPDGTETYRPTHPDGLRPALAAYQGPDGSAWRKTPRSLVDRNFMLDQRFPLAPAEGKRRVFLFGGSAALGVPIEHDAKARMGSRLQHHLRALGHDAEVLTLAGASFGSDQITGLVDDALAAQPSALVVYAGNNEAFQWALQSYKANVGWYSQVARVDGLRTVTLLRWILQSPRPPPSLVDAAELQQAVTARTIFAAWAQHPPTLDDQHRVLRTDPAAQAIARRWRENLGTIAAAAAQAGVPLVLAEIPANLLHPPEAAAHDPTLGAIGEARWAAAALAGGSMGAGDCDLAAWTRAIEIDPMHAWGWFGRGGCHLEAGDPARAQSDLANALELDAFVGRPTRSLLADIQLVGAQPGVQTVDLSGIFGPHAPKPLGEGLFADSCHLTAQGQDLVALELAKSAAEGF